MDLKGKSNSISLPRPKLASKENIVDQSHLVMEAEARRIRREAKTAESQWHADCVLQEQSKISLTSVSSLTPTLTEETLAYEICTSREKIHHILAELSSCHKEFKSISKQIFNETDGFVANKINNSETTDDDDTTLQVYTSETNDDDDGDDDDDDTTLQVYTSETNDDDDDDDDTTLQVKNSETTNQGTTILKLNNSETTVDDATTLKVNNSEKPYRKTKKEEAKQCFKSRFNISEQNETGYAKCLKKLKHGFHSTKSSDDVLSTVFNLMIVHSESFISFFDFKKFIQKKTKLNDFECAILFKELDDKNEGKISTHQLLDAITQRSSQDTKFTEHNKNNVNTNYINRRKRIREYDINRKCRIQGNSYNIIDKPAYHQSKRYLAKLNSHQRSLQISKPNDTVSENVDNIPNLKTFHDNLNNMPMLNKSTISNIVEYIATIQEVNMSLLQAQECNTILESLLIYCRSITFESHFNHGHKLIPNASHAQGLLTKIAAAIKATLNPLRDIVPRSQTSEESKLYTFPTSTSLQKQTANVRYRSSNFSPLPPKYFITVDAPTSLPLESSSSPTYMQSTRRQRIKRTPRTLKQLIKEKSSINLQKQISHTFKIYKDDPCTIKIPEKRAKSKITSVFE